MINPLRLNHELVDFVNKRCCENGVCIEIDESIPDEDVLILKIDSYYNSLHMERTPPSVDCLIIVRCTAGDYQMTLVELKNIGSGKTGYRAKAVAEKFRTTLDDFISKRFPIIGNANIRSIKLKFITPLNPFRDNGLMIETFINNRIPFQGKNLVIDPRLPTETVRRC